MVRLPGGAGMWGSARAPGGPQGWGGGGPQGWGGGGPQGWGGGDPHLGLSSTRPPRLPCTVGSTFKIKSHIIPAGLRPYFEGIVNGVLRTFNLFEMILGVLEGLFYRGVFSAF